VGKISEKRLSSHHFLKELTLGEKALSEIPEETFSDWPAIFLVGVRLGWPCSRTHHTQVFPCLSTCSLPESTHIKPVSTAVIPAHLTAFEGDTPNTLLAYSWPPASST
jgi:hypothetical protein